MWSLIFSMIGHRGCFSWKCTTWVFLGFCSFGHRDRFLRFVLLGNFFWLARLGTETVFPDLYYLKISSVRLFWAQRMILTI